MAWAIRLPRDLCSSRGDALQTAFSEIIAPLFHFVLDRMACSFDLVRRFLKLANATFQLMRGCI